MNGFLHAVLLFLFCSGVYGQGQVLFANRVPSAGLDVPLFISGTQNGPGLGHTAQLFLVGSNGSLTPLVPMTTFEARGVGPDTILDRYLVPQRVTVPGVEPGSPATFLVRAWLTSAGSYEADSHAKAESAPFTVVLGDAQNPASLVGLRSFNLYMPEPSTYVLWLVGGAIFLLFSRRSQDR